MFIDLESTLFGLDNGVGEGEERDIRLSMRRKANDGGGPLLVATPLLLNRAGARFFGGGDADDEKVDA